MVVVNSGVTILFGDSDAPAALVEIASIGGINAKNNLQLTMDVSKPLADVGIKADRVYVQCTDVPAANWGWNNKTFGN